MSHAGTTPRGPTSPNESGPVSKSNTTSATLGHSDGPDSNTNTHPADEPTYNLDRFLEQDMFDDGTLHGRVPDYDFRPRPSACKPFYKAKAVTAVDAFDTAFAAEQK